MDIYLTLIEFNGHLINSNDNGYVMVVIIIIAMLFVSLLLNMIFMSNIYLSHEEF